MCQNMERFAPVRHHPVSESPTEIPPADLSLPELEALSPSVELVSDFLASMN